MLKKIFLKSKNFLTVLFSILFAFMLIELLLRFNPSIVPTIGWQNNNLIHEKIEICQKDVIDKVAIFGDSLVEYYGKSNQNVVQKLNSKSKEVKFCNFGISGAGIEDNINRFLAVTEDIKVKKALFFLYERNDFKLYRYSDYFFENKILPYDKRKAKNRNVGTLTNFVRSTYTINILYKYIIKQYIYKPEALSNSAIKNIYLAVEKNQKIENSIEQVIEKHENFPKNKLKYINTKTNISNYIASLFWPNLYYSLNKPNPNILIKQKKTVYSQLNYINNQCKNLSIDCKFIIIPEANYVSEKFREEFLNFYGFAPDGKFSKKSLIVKEILIDFNNAYYPDKAFTYKDYIKLDGHMTNSGNEKLSEFTLKILNM